MYPTGASSPLVPPLSTNTTSPITNNNNTTTKSRPCIHFITVRSLLSPGGQTKVFKRKVRHAEVGRDDAPQTPVTPGNCCTVARAHVLLSQVLPRYCPSLWPRPPPDPRPAHAAPTPCQRYKVSSNSRPATPHHATHTAFLP